MPVKAELGVETAGENASLGLSVSGRFIDRQINSPSSENIFGVLAGLLKDAGLSIRNVSRIAVDCGPGSFTGIRIGIAFSSILGYFNRMQLDFYSGPEILEEIYRNRHGGESPSFSVIRPYKDRYIIKPASGRYRQCGEAELPKFLGDRGREHGGICGELPTGFEPGRRTVLVHPISGSDLLKHGRPELARPARPIYLFSRRYKCQVKTS